MIEKNNLDEPSRVEGTGGIGEDMLRVEETSVDVRMSSLEAKLRRVCNLKETIGGTSLHNPILPVFDGHFCTYFNINPRK